MSTNTCEDTKNKLFVSPSQQDGIAAEAEALQLAYAADLIRESAMALRLPFSACAHAQMLMQRFYTQVSLRGHCAIWVVAAVLLVAAKVGDEARSVRHVANVVYDRLNVREGDAERVEHDGGWRRKGLEFYGAAGYDWKHEVILAERHLLKELGFRIEVELGHKFILVFVNTLRERSGAAGWRGGGGGWREVLQRAWNFANDALRLRVCVTEAAEVVACACVEMGLRKMGGGGVDGWEEVFGCNREDMRRVTKEIRMGYDMGTTEGRFVDYSLTEAFKKYHSGRGNGEKKVLDCGHLKDEKGNMAGRLEGAHMQGNDTKVDGVDKSKGMTSRMTELVDGRPRKKSRFSHYEFARPR